MYTFSGILNIYVIFLCCHIPEKNVAMTKLGSGIPAAGCFSRDGSNYKAHRGVANVFNNFEHST